MPGISIPRFSQNFRTAVQQMLEDAERIVRDKWRTVEAVARELLRRGHLNRDRLEALVTAPGVTNSEVGSGAKTALVKDWLR